MWRLLWILRPGTVHACVLSTNLSMTNAYRLADNSVKIFRFLLSIVWCYLLRALCLDFCFAALPLLSWHNRNVPVLLPITINFFHDTSKQVWYTILKLVGQAIETWMTSSINLPSRPVRPPLWPSFRNITPRLSKIMASCAGGSWSPACAFSLPTRLEKFGKVPLKCFSHLTKVE